MIEPKVLRRTRLTRRHTKKESTFEHAGSGTGDDEIGGKADGEAQPVEGEGGVNRANTPGRRAHRSRRKKETGKEKDLKANPSRPVRDGWLQKKLFLLRLPSVSRRRRDLTTAGCGCGDPAQKRPGETKNAIQRVVD